jgi:hypothetical protein
MPIVRNTIANNGLSRIRLGLARVVRLRLVKQAVRPSLALQASDLVAGFLLGHPTNGILRAEPFCLRVSGHLFVLCILFSIDNRHKPNTTINHDEISSKPTALTNTVEEGTTVCQKKPFVFVE